MTDQPDELADRQRAALNRLRPPCCRESDDPQGCPQHRQQRRVLGHGGIRHRKHSAQTITTGDPGRARPAEPPKDAA